MIRVHVILFVAVALLVGAFAVLAPATIVAGRLEKATGGAFTARDVEGTVWRGRGVLAGGSAQLPLAWTVDASPLIQGELRARVTPFDNAATTPHGEIVATRTRIALRDADVTLPALLVIQPTPMGRIGLVTEGDIRFTTPSLDWTPASIEGDAQIVWRAARLTLPPFPPVALGDLTATLAANGARLAGPVVNSGGDLDVRGIVSVGADRSADVSLTLTPRKSDDTTLARVLAAFGTPDGAGWRVAWRSSPR
jgi:Type II secretion system (T2SS), protein N